MGIHLNPVCKLADETFLDKKAARKRLKELEAATLADAATLEAGRSTLPVKEKSRLSDAIHDYNLESNFLKGKFGIPN